MAEQLIVTVSGLRGIAGENLSASVAADYGRAFGSYLKSVQAEKDKKPSVCMGRDTRPSGQMLKSAVIEGLRSVGTNVVDLGIVTTPGVAIITIEMKCSGGVIVTASHNPAPYNGIKILLANGIAPPPDTAERIRRYFVERNFATVNDSSFGTVTTSGRSDAVHIGKVLSIIDSKTIAAKNFKVVLDSVNGAGGRVTKRLLAELNCNVTAINDEPTGVFAHTPEPTAANLTALCDVVKSTGAQIGFGQDPDGDRLAIVDENGTCIGEEYTVALAAKYAFSKRAGTAATNLSTSRMIDDIAAEGGGRVIRTAVGEANVGAAMIENNCIVGGEGNGGVIDLRVSPVRDSLVGIALVLQLVAETSKTISQLAEEIGRYFMIKDKFTADSSQAQRVLDLVKETFADARLDTTDGCRFDFDAGWLHVRASNTEPVVRVIAEAKNQATARKYVDAVLDIHKKVIG
jgi:phosphomannomutase